MISERQNDGVDRERTQWFRRANSAHPERGGAAKSRAFHGRDWMEHARERWAELTTQMLKAHGREERVDHRSYERQGIDLEPGRHYGPAAAHMVARGIDHDRLDESAARVDRQDAIQAIDGDLERLENSSRGGARSALGHDDEEPEHRRDRGRDAPGRDEDSCPGR